MTSVTLYREGTLLTDASLQYGGNIYITSGDNSGESHLIIAPSEQHSLLLTLRAGTQQRIPMKFFFLPKRKKILFLLERRFTTTSDDPYLLIREFLESKKIKFTSQYWPNR